MAASNLSEEEVIANVAIVILTFGFGGEQFSVGGGGDVKIIVVSAGSQTHLQNASVGKIADPG
jgi:Flp pilus assembly protein protease CpaA